MISYNLVRKLSSSQGIPESTIEKDYLIELLLRYISGNDFLNKNFVFRGGTALKKIYFPEFRYSEDLDFIVLPGEKLSLYADNLENVRDAVNADFPAELLMTKPQFPQRGHLQLFFRYNLVPEIIARKELKMDIIGDEVILSHTPKRVLFSYDDFKQINCSLSTYDVEAITVEKIGRILDVVDEPRDLWDLRCLLKYGVDSTKTNMLYARKYGTKIIQENLIDAIRKSNYKKLWEVRLKNHISQLPEYKNVITELEMLVKSMRIVKQ